MQCLAQLSALQHPAKARGLVWGFEERVIAVEGGVLALDDILDLADRFRRDIPNALKMLWNEEEIPGIDMPFFDEASRFLRAAAGIVLVHQAALVVHEAVQVAASTSQALAGIVGGSAPRLGPERA